MSEINETMNIGDKVTFDADKVDLFIEETTSDDPSIQQYQKLVLAGIDQIGVVKGFNGNLSIVSYPDGWDLPVPTKHLVVLPE